MARLNLCLMMALASVNVSSTAAQADGCPAPLVELRNQINGSEVNRALLLAQQLPGGPAGVLGERALNHLIDANGGAIRFVQGVGSAPDADFVIAVDETVADAQRTATLSLRDQKGRSVLAPASFEFTSEQLLGDSLDILARRVTQPMVPLLPVLRDYQRRIREQENSAIYALLRVNPQQGTVEPAERLQLQLELVDCDEGNPPLPNRAVSLEHSGVGELDRTQVTTDADGKASVVFQSSDRGAADIVPVWAYDNTAGIPTVADADVAKIRVEPPFGFSRVSVSPLYQPESSEDMWYLGYLWVLTDELVDLDYPEDAIQQTREAPSPVCGSRMNQHEGGVAIPKGESLLWEPDGALDRQRAASLIQAVFDSARYARLHLNLSAHGEREAKWDEEDGSEVEATAAFDLILDIENPQQRDYALVVNPRGWRAVSQGAGEYALNVWMGGTGCEGSYSSGWNANLSGSDGEHQDRSGRGTRVTVKGDRHVEMVLRIQGAATAHGNKMESPYDGDAGIELDLELTVEPLPVGGNL